MGPRDKPEDDGCYSAGAFAFAAGFFFAGAFFFAVTVLAVSVGAFLGAAAFFALTGFLPPPLATRSAIRPSASSR